MNPQFLPGGDVVLFTAMDSAGHLQGGDACGPGDRGAHKPFTHGGSLARYLASGHIAYGLDGSLMVVPFNLESRQVTGRSEAVLDGLLMGFSNGELSGSFRRRRQRYLDLRIGSTGFGRFAPGAGSI